MRIAAATPGFLKIDARTEGRWFSVADVDCTHGKGGWSRPEQTSDHAIVFVHRGHFRRRVDGREYLVGPKVVYFQRPGEEQQIAHPFAGGDACLSIRLSADLVGAAAAGELPGGPVLLGARQHWASRIIGARARAGASAHELEDDLLALLADLVPGIRPARGEAAPPSVVALTRRAQEALAAQPDLTLRRLAAELACSPGHLSRSFTRVVGEPFTTYRNGMRARLALEAIARGEPFARIAARLGYADQAHLTRSIRRETGRTPSQASRALIA